MTKEVILLNPSFSSLPDTGVPAGLLSVTAHTQRDIPVRIIDEKLEPISLNEIDGALVGITVMTPAASRAKELAQEAIRAGAYGVVFGGIHPTVCTQEMANYGTVLRGEIEGGSWDQVLLDYRNNRELAKVYYSPLVRLQNLPLANREIYDYARKANLQQISHARGCPMGCDYCTVHLVAGKTIRYRPTEEVIAELQVRGLLETNPGVITLFTSDNFGILHSDKELLKRLRKELDGKDFSWFAQVGIGTLNDDEFLALANSVGKCTLAVGVESPFREGLRKVKKGIGEIDLIRVFEKVKNYPNISTLLLLMVGFDFEPMTVFQDTLRFIEQTRPNGVYLSILTPLPGSQIAAKLESEGRIFERDWSFYDTRHLVHRARYMRGEEDFGEWSPKNFMEGYNWLVQQSASVMREWRTLQVPVR